MKKFVVLGFFFMLGVAAFAQDEPRYEMYLGYSFTRVNSAINVPAFSANGGQGEFAINFTKMFAGVASINAVHNGNINDRHIDQTLVSPMFGPRANFRFGRITPFGEVLFGWSHDSRSFRLSTIGVNPPAGSPTTLSSRFVSSGRSFSMATGGGIDLPINRHVAFRPVKFEYFLTRFQPIFIQGLGGVNRNRNQNNLIYTTGFNFRF